jgi:sialidase-1
MPKSIVFEKGVTLNPAGSAYGLEIRIPAIVRSGDTLVAFAEGRNSGVTLDWGNIDLICRRSTDYGATWGSVIYVDDNGTACAGNPGPVVNSQGHIICLFVRQSTSDGTTRRAWYKKSTDAGATWGSAVSIDADVNPWHDGMFTFGPSHGVRLRYGANAGRLLVPFGSNGSTWKAGAVYSDDDGTTWNLGGYTSETSGVFQPQETSITETPDGTIVMINRNQGGSGSHKSRSYSEDGGMSFSAAQSTTIVSGEAVQGSVYQHWGSHSQPLLYSTPQAASLGVPRYKGVVVRSFDEGATWDSGTIITDPNSTTERYAYSDLVETGQDTFGVLYETGTDVGGEPYRWIKYQELRVSPITQRGSASTDKISGADRSTLSVTKPTGTVAGDVLVAFFTRNGVAVTPPSGFTQVYSRIADTNGLTTSMYVKVAGGSEPATYDWTSGSGPIMCTITAWTGVDNVNPIGAANFASSGGAGVSEPATTPTISANTAQQGRLFYFRSTFLASATVVTLAGPGGTVSEVFEESASTASNSHRTHALYTESTDFTRGGASKVGAAITATGTETKNTYATFVLQAAQNVDSQAVAPPVTASASMVKVGAKAPSIG